MVKIKLFLFFFVLSMVSAETLTSPDSENAQNDFQSRCSDILKEAGATSQFGGITGHAIHSISVRVLKKFKHNVTENNRVPTINMNLTSDQPILPYAPDRSTPDSKHFHTDGMKILDEVLTHMDDSSYDVKNLSPLEKIAHAFHMEEMWVAALHAYRKLKQDPPSEEVCNCAMDIDNNGILKQLRFAALGIREPQLVYQDKLQRFKRQLSYHITYSKSFKKRSIPEQMGSEFQPSEVLLNEKVSGIKITNAEGWKKWKAEDKGMKHQKDLAIFLYCALN